MLRWSNQWWPLPTTQRNERTSWCTSKGRLLSSTMKSTYWPTSKTSLLECYMSKSKLKKNWRTWSIQPCSRRSPFPCRLALLAVRLSRTAKSWRSLSSTSSGATMLPTSYKVLFYISRLWSSRSMTCKTGKVSWVAGSRNATLALTSGRNFRRWSYWWRAKLRSKGSSFSLKPIMMRLNNSLKLCSMTSWWMECWLVTRQ